MINITKFMEKITNMTISYDTKIDMVNHLS